jgi:hypothetical protein
MRNMAREKDGVADGVLCFFFFVCVLGFVHVTEGLSLLLALAAIVVAPRAGFGCLRPPAIISGSCPVILILTLYANFSRNPSLAIDRVRNHFSLARSARARGA